ncbi:hypothetical protein EXS65_04855 [Candidatus Peribacteria bacterium]|nr:hypothetical protein [Candidatus Peribacteria bacterium]
MLSSQLIERPCRCLLIGNYGVGNIGDEALKAYFLGAFPEIEWTVVSAAPERGNEVPRLPFGLRSFFRPWMRTLLAIARSDAVVFGGGSLFTDSESVFACVLWWWHALVCRIFRKRLLMAFQGVGPFRTSCGKRLARSTFRSAAFVSVRDSASLRGVQSWNLRTTPVLTFDPVFAYFATRKPLPSSKKILSIIPRGNSNDAFFTEFGIALKQTFHEVRILLMQPSALECSIAEKIKAATSTPSVIVSLLSAEQLLEEISMSSQVISQRYHGALAALAVGIPVTIVPQTSSDKLWELREMQHDPEGLWELDALAKKGEEGLRRAMIH